MHLSSAWLYVWTNGRRKRFNVVGLPCAEKASNNCRLPAPSVIRFNVVGLPCAEKALVYDVLRAYAEQHNIAQLATTGGGMTITTSRFCSVCARQAGLDPGGYGGAAYDTIIAVELPLPWPVGMFNDPARMPPEVLAVMQQIHDEYVRTRTLRTRLLGIAPDADYSTPGMRRVIAWRRPDGPFAQFDRVEYLVPEAQVGPLVFALACAPERLPEFAACRQETGDVRDLLVCTHGSVDAACSKFGYPTYARLRRIAASLDGRLRAWRTTHFGGHVFAPTLIDLPHGSYWAYIERDEAELLIQRTGDPARLRGCYRGWAGLPPPFLQVLERELFVRHGWVWLQYAKAGWVLAQDATTPLDAEGHAIPTWAEVRLDYHAPDGRLRGACTARVALAGRVVTIPSSGDPATYPYPQYAVTRLEAVE